MNETGRKIPPEFENPFDNVLISLATIINPYLRRFGFTPNILTLCALITGVFAAYATWKSWFISAALFTLISYFFDTLDGNMARMFNMMSAFGDILDHGSDIIKYLLLFVALWYTPTLTKRFKTIAICILFVLYVFVSIHIGCQEKSYTKLHPDTLTPLEIMCPHPSYIRITRWFGIGTWILTLTCILLIARVIKKPI